MNNYEKMANAFEIEELEERVEFAEWSASAGCETDFNGNSSCEAGVEVKF